MTAMNEFGFFAYIASSVMFAGLVLLLVTSLRGRTVQTGLLLFATTMTVVWGAFLAYDNRAPIPLPWLFLVEMSRDVAWLTFLAGVLRLEGSGALNRVIRYVIYAIWGGIVVGFIALWALVPKPFAETVHTNTFIVTGFLLSLMGLILVEQLYRNTPDQFRWGMKYLCLGVGGLFAYDLFLFSHSLLFREITGELWAARGAANALVVPLIAVAAHRNPSWAVDIFISRHVAFYSTSILGVGLYLIAMALGGYYIRIYGGDWGSAAEIVFLFGAALLLFVMLISEQMRARLKVFLNKHFYRYRYDYRQEWLRLIETMSATEIGGTLQEQAIRGVTQLVGSRDGGLWIRRDDDQLLPAGGGLGSPAAPAIALGSPLAKFLAQRKWIIDLEEYRSDCTQYDGLEIPAWLVETHRAWLIVPLILADELFGFVLIEKPRARQKLVWEDHDLLKTVGRQIATYLALDDAARKLTENSQFQAFNRLTAFIMHDLKNLIAQQNLVVRNAALHKDNPEFVDDAIKTVENCVERMSKLLSQLQGGETVTATGATVTDVRAVCRQALTLCGRRKPEPELLGDGADLEVRANPDQLTQILTHLVKNAQEATQEHGWVRVALSRKGADAVIEIADNGVGMDASFVRQCLFQPFYSTKGSQGMGIGAYQAKEFVRLAGGKLSVDSGPGEGTVITVALPCAGDAGSGE